MTKEIITKLKTVFRYCSSSSVCLPTLLARENSKMDDKQDKHCLKKVTSFAFSIAAPDTLLCTPFKMSKSLR